MERQKKNVTIGCLKTVSSHTIFLCTALCGVSMRGNNVANGNVISLTAGNNMQNSLQNWTPQKIYVQDVRL